VLYSAHTKKDKNIVLNREKLAGELSLITSKLFPETTEESELAQKKWNDLAADDSFLSRSKEAQSSFLIPTWDGRLSDTYPVEKTNNNYTVIAVDGSQIYPDRHVGGASCFLINTGGVVLKYGSNSSVSLFSNPKILLHDDIPSDLMFSKELIDFKREEFELLETVKVAISNKDNPTCFIDGSIIFWQLEGKTADIKNYFLTKYIRCLEELRENKIPVVGYISMPKSRELINLIKLGFCRLKIADCILCHKNNDSFPCKVADGLLDTHIARKFLEKNERTTVFYSNSKIVESYPEELRPAFVYCNIGHEIIRLEIPTWVAHDKVLLNKTCSIATDQAQKGNGYPVCLAESHEQAIVKGQDREFFYHLIHKVGVEQNKKINFSQKSIKKRGIGI
jgi:hypothetical protein